MEETREQSQFTRPSFYKLKQNWFAGMEAGSSEPVNSGPSAFHVFRSSDRLSDFKRREASGAIGDCECEYGRYRQSEWIVLEKSLARLEGAEAALSFPSGMAAITVLFDALCPTQADPIHVIATAQGYRKTRTYLAARALAPQFELTLLQPEDFCRIQDFIRPHTKLIFIESPSNPFLRVIDLEPIAEICKERNIISVVDHTFASPFNIQPLSYGIDLVAVSATKYHGGHNDLLAGYVAGKKTLLKALEDLRGTLGSVISAETAQRLSWYLNDMRERMVEHNRNGLLLARELETSESCDKVWYPGLSSHPDYEIACKQLHGFGGVVTCELKTDLDHTKDFVDRLLDSGLCFAGPSFGGDKNLISHVPLISHFHETPAQRAAQGIGDSLIRFAIAPGDQSEFISLIGSELRRW